MISPLANLDYQLVSRASDWTGHSVFSFDLIYILAELLILIFPLVLYYLWMRPEKKGERHGAQKAVVLALVGVVLVMALKTVITFFWVRERPFLAHPDLFTLGFAVDPPSFPSGHALVGTVIAASLYFSGFRRLGVWLLMIAAIIALARVFAGVHYFSDVIGGYLIGLLVAWYLHRESSTLKRYLPDY